MYIHDGGGDEHLSFIYMFNIYKNCCFPPLLPDVYIPTTTGNGERRVVKGWSNGVGPVSWSHFFSILGPQADF